MRCALLLLLALSACRALEVPDAGEVEPDGGGVDAGPGGTSCTVPDGGQPCCDADGNVVGQLGCFEDAGAICLSGDVANCP